MSSVILDRDGGFSSGGDEDEGFYSHTDASDDSADIKVRNKRKCSEPRRLETELPAKKRKLDMGAKTSPFRPWSPRPKTWRHDEKPRDSSVHVPQPRPILPIRFQEEPLSLVSKKKDPVIKVVPPSKIMERLPDTPFKIDNILVKSDQKTSQSLVQSQQNRNYKNMTRERRIEANARERTRVHTISAAFDTLRNTIPAYSHNQKLSKLSVLRIACSYIVTLSRLSGQDYSSDQSQPDLSECVSNVAKTIQTEGKIRKKKDE